MHKKPTKSLQKTHKKLTNALFQPQKMVLQSLTTIEKCKNAPSTPLYSHGVPQITYKKLTDLNFLDKKKPGNKLPGFEGLML